MKILVVAATSFEISLFLNDLTPHYKENDGILHYQMKNTSIDVLITGIGMVQAAYYLGKQLACAKYDLAINAGIGGAYIEDLKIGEVVHVTEECITEFGAENGESFLSVFELGLIDPDGMPFSNGRLVNNRPIDNSTVVKLKSVKGATINTIRSNPANINKVRNHFHAEEESMEGAACFYAFLSERVPFAEIRAISNYVAEVHDRTRWNTELALKNLNSVLAAVLREMCV